MLRFILPITCLLAIACAAKAESPSHRFITADSSKGRIAIIAADGRTEWEYKIGPLHDLHVLPDGHVLFQDSWTHLLEVDPKTNKIVWQYDSAKQNGNEGKGIEVHAFQRLDDGVTMIAESGVVADHRGRSRRQAVAADQASSQQARRPSRYAAGPQAR